MMRVSQIVWLMASLACGGSRSTDSPDAAGHDAAVADRPGARWSDNIQPFCTSALRLYCVEQ